MTSTCPLGVRCPCLNRKRTDVPLPGHRSSADPHGPAIGERRQHPTLPAVHHSMSTPTPAIPHDRGMRQQPDHYADPDGARSPAFLLPMPGSDAHDGGLRQQGHQSQPFREPSLSTAQAGTSDTSEPASSRLVLVFSAPVRPSFHSRPCSAVSSSTLPGTDDQADQQ